MAAFFGSLAAIFGLEMFDKTQLVALCLASRYKVKVVLAGILVATLVVHVLSVALGGGLGKLMPQEWINLVAGLAFIGFGLWTLKGDSLDDEECNRLCRIGGQDNAQHGRPRHEIPGHPRMAGVVSGDGCVRRVGHPGGAYPWCKTAGPSNQGRCCDHLLRIRRIQCCAGIG